jgi:chitinase
MIREGILRGCLVSSVFAGLVVASSAAHAADQTLDQSDLTRAVATEHRVSPYQDVSLGLDESALVQAAGLKSITFAFVEAASSSDCIAAWGGLGPISSDTTIGGYVSNIREAGGDVSFSFGGAVGFELAGVCQSVADLQAQYQHVIDKYHLRRLDFDIEVDDGDSIDNTVAIDRRSQALAALQRANPGLLITYALPVAIDGLLPNALFVLKSALRFGVHVHGVNILTMDYGSGDPTIEGRNAISSTQHTLGQLAQIGLHTSVGIVVLPGKEDTFTPAFPEQFTLSQAREVLRYADEHRGQINLLSFWELSRDQACPGGGGGPDENTCSSISQRPYEFSHIFARFGPRLEEPR